MKQSQHKLFHEFKVQIITGHMTIRAVTIFQKAAFEASQVALWLSADVSLAYSEP